MSEQLETLDDVEQDSAPPLPSVGEIVADRYRIVRGLGRGGSSEVFEAEHVELGRRHAIKFLRRHRTTSALARFKQEAKLLATLSHPHIAALFDIGLYREVAPYIVLEYADGRTLRAELREKKKLEVPQALAILEQLCSAVAHAHSHGVVHRDLKPENIVLCEEHRGKTRVSVLDFGIARVTAGDGPKLTPTGAQLGTPHYMAPEQARGDGQVGPLVDVYALGVILYEMLSGSRPHPGESYYAVVFHLLTQPPVPLESAAPDCPAEVRNLIDRCLRRDPSERFQSADDLRNAVLGLGRSMRTPDAATPLRKTRAVWSAGVFLAAGAVLGGTGVSLMSREPSSATSGVDAAEVASDFIHQSAPTQTRQNAELRESTSDGSPTTDSFVGVPSTTVEAEHAQAPPNLRRPSGASVGAPQGTKLEEVIKSPTKDRAQESRTVASERLPSPVVSRDASPPSAASSAPLPTAPVSSVIRRNPYD